MTNPYADTPLWARYYSESMGWPVTASVLNAADGPVRCDVCGATETRDEAWPSDKGLISVVRAMSLESDYCHGCGIVWCQDCQDKVPEIDVEHTQEAHRP